MYLNLKCSVALLLSIAGLFMYAPASEAQSLIKKTLNDRLDLSNNPLSSSSVLSSLLDSSNTTPGLAQKPKTATERLNSTFPRYAQSPAPSSPPPDKSQYNLFNPTPKELLREFSTDRPNLATSPITVDAGHFYTETDVINYTRKGVDENGDTTEKFLFGSTTLRAGLTNNVEFRLLFQPYNLARTTSRGTGEVQKSAGFDTLQPGLKINIYGNDTYKKPGDTAFALFPFINIPTAQKGLGGNSVEGGLTTLFIYKISNELDIEVNVELDAIKNGASDGYHIESANVVSLDYQITPSLGTFFEIATRFNNESQLGAIATFDTGLLLNIGNDTQIDLGAFIGLTHGANDINPYLGFSKRF